MELDIGRLHDVLEGKYEGVRRAGHTTAMIVRLIQAADLLDGTYAVIVVNRTMVDYLIDMVSELYKTIYPGSQVTINRRNGFLQFGNTKIKFVTQTNIYRSLVGIQLDNYYLDGPVELSEAEYLALQAATTYK
jgi:hypothetical protein